MAKNIRLAGNRFNPGDPVHASFEPDTGVDVVFWRLFRAPSTDIALTFEEVHAGQQIYDFDAPELTPGTYHLQVYTLDWASIPRSPDAKLSAGQADLGAVKVEHLIGLDRADEQVFQIAVPPVVRMALDRSRAERLVGTDPLARFADFEQYLKDKGTSPAGDNPFDGGRSAYATFSDDNYLQLKNLARAFVRTIRVKSLRELAEPYIRDRMNDEPALPPTYQDPVMRFFPGVELIWNFWQESGMFIQTLNLILARFQNRVVSRRYAPLDRFDITPLATLHALLYAFVDDEQHRMTVRRRAAEYEYEYGLKLIGKAIPPGHSFVERRSAFLESFHTVLHQAHIYFKEDDDLTVNADAFPLYRSLRECHLELSHGTHNQYGQLAVSARAEFLLMQYLLAQPEMRQFLGGRPMTPYPEPWMDRVDRMKEIQPGWPAASTMHFHDLATIGERLVLTIRLGSWADPQVDSTHAKGWAAAFREPIQKYVAAYRAVTGVDLAVAPDSTQPAVLIQERAREQRIRA